MAKDVFISYYRGDDQPTAVTPDRRAADEIYLALDKLGISCFIDYQDILPGSDWSDTLLDGVEQAKVLVLIVSRSTEQSEWIRDEVGLALNNKIPIIPFCIDTISPKDFLRRLVVRCQWIRANSHPSSDFIDTLIKAVCIHLGRPYEETSRRDVSLDNETVGSENNQDRNPERKKLNSEVVFATKEKKEHLAKGNISEKNQEHISKEKPTPGKVKTVTPRVPKRLIWFAASLAVVIALTIGLSQINWSSTPASGDKGSTKVNQLSPGEANNRHKVFLEKAKDELKKKDYKKARENIDLAKGIKTTRETQEIETQIDVQTVAQKIGFEKVYRNNKGYWEADYGDGIVMVYIPPGEFTMGSNDGQTDEKPVHTVYLDGYWIGKYEVTINQYMKFVDESKSHYPEWLEKGYVYDINTGSDDYYKKFVSDKNYPIVGVSWKDGRAYCQWLSKKIGLSFKLPTEAQWEKAARGTGGRIYPWGNEFEKDKCNSGESGLNRISPVGSYPGGASPYGLFDMAGNVWEWCSDWYDGGYYKKSPDKNPQGPDVGSPRVIRGGCWGLGSAGVRCAYRYGAPPAGRGSSAGFRLSEDF